MKYKDFKVFVVEDNTAVNYYVSFNWFGAAKLYFEVFGGETSNLKIHLCDPKANFTIIAEDPIEFPENATILPDGRLSSTKTMKEWADWKGKPGFLYSSMW